jgi:hypothetical protein
VPLGPTQPFSRHEYVTVLLNTLLIGSTSGISSKPGRQLRAGE